jgi:hypothetical protein
MPDNHVYILPSSQYNQIADIHDQAVPPTSQLLGVGKILVQHDMHRKLGVHLLHRHFAINEGMIILNSLDGEAREIAQMTDIAVVDITKLRAHGYMLDHDSIFVPYEYEESSAPVDSVPQPALDDLAEYLVANNLQHVLAIEKINPDVAHSGIFMAEYNLHKTGTYRKLVQRKDEIGRGKPTAWVFDVGDDGEVTCENICIYNHCS